MPVIVRWLLSLVPTNPIVVRLVQGGSRRARHMYIRAGYLALLIVVLLALLLQMQAGATTFRQLAASAAKAFEWVAYLQIGLICILSPVFMAGAIAQESNPRTWDILLTTPLSAAQIVLGQLFGRLFFVLALLLASLPLFAITQYFGGVPGRAVFLSYAVSACAALLVGAIAVALSVNRLAGRRAVFSFYVAVVTYLAATIGIDIALRAGSSNVTWMTPLNPFLALNSLLSPSTYRKPPEIELAAMGWIRRMWFGSPVLTWCIVSGGLSVLLMGISTFTARTIVSEGGTPWYRKMLGFSSKGLKVRAPRNVWNNPIAWREAAARQATLPKIVARWTFVALGVLWALGLIIYFHQGGISASGFRLALLTTVWTELIVIALVAINVSATAISREREDGTLDILLTTPITQVDYINGKLRGLISYLIPLLAVPLGTLALVSIYVLAHGFGRTGGAMVSAASGTMTVNVPLVLPEAAVLAPLVVLPFMAFCVMVGLQWSLKSKGTIASVVGTVGVVGVISGVIGLCGWQAGRSIDFAGPAIAALNPLTTIRGLIFPEDALEGAVGGKYGLTGARIGLAIGATAAVGVYFAVVTGMRASMVRTFDTATRKLAGSA